MPVWTGAESRSYTGIRSPDRPARSQSLYPLHYPAHTIIRSPDRPASSESLYRLRYPDPNSKTFTSEIEMFWFCLKISVFVFLKFYAKSKYFSSKTSHSEF